MAKSKKQSTRKTAKPEQFRRTRKKGKGAKKPLVYITDTYDEFNLPQYNGQRYEAMVPDTYDIQERALAVQNVLTRAVDPEWDSVMYFRVEFARNPAMMWHGLDDTCNQKYMHTLPLIRLITGDDSKMEVDRGCLEAAMKQIGPDGINYFPRYPFDSWNFSKMLNNPGAKHYAMSNTTYLAPFALQHLLRPSKVWLDYMHRQIEGMSQLTVDRGGWAYAPYRLYPYGKKWSCKNEAAPLGAAASESTGYSLQGLVQCYIVSGYEPAGELARKVSYFLKDHALLFDKAGRFLPNTPPIKGKGQSFADMSSGGASHFHAHTICLLNILGYALHSEDQELTEFVKSSFEWARYQGEQTLLRPSTRLSSAKYVTEGNLGYFPENLFATYHEQAESCEVADMIGIGLKLSAGGVGDYWDDVDRWIRNQFAENQLMDTRWLHKFSESLPISRPETDELYCEEDVIERNRGAFAGWALPNAWMGEQAHFRKGIMHCCTANGARAIYYIWEHILHHDKGKLKVNLLLNRASQWADVDSHIPYQGRVDIRIKRAVDLEVRMPKWVDLKKVGCEVDGRNRQAKFVGRYLKVGKVTPGKLVVISFPIAETRKALEIEKYVYDVVLRGADVVKIDPPGVLGPFYQRDHYRTGETRWRKVQRFATTREVAW